MGVASAACPADSSSRTDPGGRETPDSSSGPRFSSTEEVQADRHGAGFARPRLGNRIERLDVIPTASRRAGRADVATRQHTELDTAHRAVPPDAQRVQHAEGKRSQAVSEASERGVARVVVPRVDSSVRGNAVRAAVTKEVSTGRRGRCGHRRRGQPLGVGFGTPRGVPSGSAFGSKRGREARSPDPGSRCLHRGP
jgi:hypothetical protein